jgi:hypothetical protein
MPDRDTVATRHTHRSFTQQRAVNPARADTLNIEIEISWCRLYGPWVAKPAGHHEPNPKSATTSMISRDLFNKNGGGYFRPGPAVPKPVPAGWVVPHELTWFTTGRIAAARLPKFDIRF